MLAPSAGRPVEHAEAARLHLTGSDAADDGPWAGRGVVCGARCTPSMSPVYLYRSRVVMTPIPVCLSSSLPCSNDGLASAAVSVSFGV